MTQKPSPEQRRALGTFLASRRARLRPVDFGLAELRRRTPGLRREEVAVLAGVSLSWYTWLEQGRDIQASADTLRRVSDVLKLNRVESAHLFALSARDAPPITSTDELSDGLLMLLRVVDPLPAYIRNRRFDILAWNAAVAELFVDYGVLQPHERNTVRLLFLYPPYRTLIVDWEEMSRGMLSNFSAARAQAQDKTLFDSLIDELNAASQEFRQWWPQADVGGFDEGVKQIRHPTQGRIDLTYIALAPQGRPDLSLVTYIPRPAAYEPGS